MVDDHGNNLAAGIPVLLFLLADLNPTVNRMGRCK
jgi:hypothetical protein